MIMFNKEQLQRFSIRKLTVGAASVLIGVLFLTSWNTNTVYADSINVTSGESIAKNNNPQEGNLVSIKTMFKLSIMIVQR